MLLKVRFIKKGIKLRRVNTRNISKCNQCVYGIDGGWWCIAKARIRNAYYVLSNIPYNTTSSNYGYIPERIHT